MIGKVRFELGRTEYDIAAVSTNRGVRPNFGAGVVPGQRGHARRIARRFFPPIIGRDKRIGASALTIGGQRDIHVADIYVDVFVVVLRCQLLGSGESHVAPVGAYGWLLGSAK